MATPAARLGALARSAGSRLRHATQAATPSPAPKAEQQPIVITTSAPSPEGVAAVPRGVRSASEWAWRGLLIAAAVVATLKLISILSTVVFPIIIALLLSALLSPIHQRLARVLPRGLAAGVTVLGTLAVLVALISFVVNQFANQVGDIADQVGQGVGQSRTWIEQTFGVSQGELTTWLTDTWRNVQEQADWQGTAAQAGLTAGHLATGFFLAMFTLFFFLYDGPGIWAWVVRLFPRGARAKVLSSGSIAWSQLKAFTRATILVAAVDAIGISLGALALGVPFASGIALLVFLGAFVPIVGALLSGFIAVALAFVAQGPLTALLMLLVVLAVQQLESHVLQPLLMGRIVRVHPLAVILGIAVGIIVGGIIGALTAVPLIAVLNSVGHNLLDAEHIEVESTDDLPTTPDEDAVIEKDIARNDEISTLEPGESPYST